MVEPRIKTIKRKKLGKHVQVPIPENPFPKLLLEDDVIVLLADDIDAIGYGKEDQRRSLCKLCKWP